MKISTDSWHQILQSIKNDEYTKEHLDLSDLGLNAVNIKQLINALELNHSITSLDLKNNKLGDEGLKVLATNTTLISLDISNNSIGTRDPRVVAREAAANQKLVDLGLDPIHIEPLPGLHALSNHPTLKNLNVSHNQLGFEAAKVLAKNTTITSLDISFNEITSKGAEFLAQNTTLKSLNVFFNHITETSAKALAQNTTLTSLHIYSKEITAMGVNALTQSKTLIDLNIDYRKIPFETWHKLLSDIESNQYTDTHLWSAPLYNRTI